MGSIPTLEPLWDSGGTFCTLLAQLQTKPHCGCLWQIGDNEMYRAGVPKADRALWLEVHTM